MSLITDSNFARVQLAESMLNATPKLRRPDRLGRLVFALVVFAGWGAAVVAVWKAIGGMVG